MKLNKLAVFASDLSKSIKFYSILGFKFPKLGSETQHIESEGEGISLMLDEKEFLAGLIGAEPIAGNFSSFAIEYDSIEELDNIVAQLIEHDFTVYKQPKKMFWGQYYAVVKDPDSNMVDLYVNLT